jgi:anti-anti-sigma factor
MSRLALEAPQCAGMTDDSRSTSASVDRSAPAAGSAPVPLAGFQTPDNFSVVSCPLDHRMLVSIAGEIDISTTPLLERDLRQAQRTADAVILDLAQVSFMDCSGLRVILQANRRAHERGGRLIVTGARRQTRRLFELTDVLGELTLIDSPEQAVDVPSAR